MEINFWIIIAAIFIGFSKAGFSGISLLSVSLFAFVYGAKPAVGIVLPLLIFADCIVYPLWKQYGDWKIIFKLLPGTFIGLTLGLLTLWKLPDMKMYALIGCIILLMIGLQFLIKYQFVLKPEKKLFRHMIGFLIGYSTTVANAAGPLMQLYLLSLKLPKMQLIGIGVRFFLFINLVKLPLFYKLDLINQQSLMINFYLIPFIILGIFLGRWLIIRISQRYFEWIIISSAFIVAIRLLFR